MKCVTPMQAPNGTLHDCGRPAIVKQVWRPIDRSATRTTFRCHLHQLEPGPQLVSTEAIS